MMPRGLQSCSYGYHWGFELISVSRIGDPQWPMIIYYSFWRCLPRDLRNRRLSALILNTLSPSHNYSLFFRKILYLPHCLVARNLTTSPERTKINERRKHEAQEKSDFIDWRDPFLDHRSAQRQRGRRCSGQQSTGRSDCV